MKMKSIFSKLKLIQSTWTGFFWTPKFITSAPQINGNVQNVAWELHPDTSELRADPNSSKEISKKKKTENEPEQRGGGMDDALKFAAPHAKAGAERD